MVTGPRWPSVLSVCTKEEWPAHWGDKQTNFVQRGKQKACKRTKRLVQFVALRCDGSGDTVTLPYATYHCLSCLGLQPAPPLNPVISTGRGIKPGSGSRDYFSPSVQGLSLPWSKRNSGFKGEQEWDCFQIGTDPLGTCNSGYVPAGKLCRPCLISSSLQPLWHCTDLQSVTSSFQQGVSVF